MPYITKVRASELMDGADIANKGELNFLITSLMVTYLHHTRISYNTISDAIGAAQDAADEMKRRLLSIYEDTKRYNTSNTDPYRVIIDDNDRFKS